MHIYLYGPPGSGKSTIGGILAERLDLPFVDLDSTIEAAAGLSISEMFATRGEAAFRDLESLKLRETALNKPAVIALGGGALLKDENRALAERTGTILCFEASLDVLAGRVDQAPGKRPLLSSERRRAREAPSALARLLAARAPHYASFERRLKVENRPAEITADHAQQALGFYRVAGMGTPYNVLTGTGLLDTLGSRFSELGGGGRAVVVGDEHTLPLYGQRVEKSLQAHGVTVSSLAIPAGEAIKYINTVASLWSAFLRGGIERGDTVIALGGGVTGDLTGFAAATWLRGVRWIGLPTTLLAMVDSSLGGKTGADLPEGKNLIGAFHPPALVVADPATLATLPACELRYGLAEVIKHAIIGDPELLELMPRFSFLRGLADSAPCGSLAAADWLDSFVVRAMAVKVRVIQQDPFEKGVRAALNLGHTIGHGIEKATDFALRHGEAVAIGTVLEARVSETLGLAVPGLAERLAEIFSAVGLPVSLPGGLDLAAVRQAITLDKKKSDGRVRFALPIDVGEVQTGVDVPAAVLDSILKNGS